MTAPDPSTSPDWPAPVAPAAPESVRGGSAGIEADYDSLTATARQFGAATTDLGSAALSMNGYLADPGLATSGILDPGGAALAVGRLADALDGPHGLTVLAARCAAADAGLRGAALGYEGVDDLKTFYDDDVAGWVDLKGALIAGAVRGIETGSISAGVQRVITDDPQLVDSLANQSLLGGAATALGFTDPDGHAVVHPLGTDSEPESSIAPHDLTDVMDGLAARNATEHGEVDVRFLSGNGPRRVIVDIPGTKSWDLGRTSDVTSFSTNLRARVGTPTAYEQGVLEAMQDAGVTSRDDVMLVGHSEGGMVAVEAARDAVDSGEFHISHVLTAGSPVGLTAGQLPHQVQLLALENDQDVVPHLDGRTNPASTNVTTVTTPDLHGSLKLSDPRRTISAWLSPTTTAPCSTSRQHAGSGWARSRIVCVTSWACR